MRNSKLALFILIGIILVVSLLLGACTTKTTTPAKTTTTATAVPVIELKFGILFAPDTPDGRVDVAWIDKIHK